jgi:hypothetical protein
VLGARARTTAPGGERVATPEFAHPLDADTDAVHRSGLIPAALIEISHPSADQLLKEHPTVVVWAADQPARP